MTCKTHSNHEHKHGSSCGHKTVRHEDHVDYLHDNHLHHVHDGHVDEHSLAESDKHKSVCTPDHVCSSHDRSHKHGPGCGHEAIPHGNHIDFVVGEHLHHPCASHCDHHGSVTAA